MSMFTMPTASAPMDSGVGRVTNDEIAPSGSFRPDGGGSVTFEMSSSANSYFVPRMSYFNYRLRVTKTAAKAALTVADGEAIGAGVQFRSNPISAVVNSFSHSINGVNIETVSNVPECAAILNRTSLSHEFLNSSGGSMQRLVGWRGNRNSLEDGDQPAGALQPWDGVAEVFDCSWLPPSGFFNMPGSLPGGRHRFVLAHNANLLERCIVMGADRAALAAGDYISVEIVSITLHATHMIPDIITPIPRNVVLSLHPLTIVMSQLSNTAGATTHTLSVPPSTDRLFVCANLQSAGTTCDPESGHGSFAARIQNLQVSYAGITMPQNGYTNCAWGVAEREVLKPYADFLAATGRLYMESSAYDTMEEFAASPIFALTFEKARNDSSTSVQVRMSQNSVLYPGSIDRDFAAGNLVVAAQSHIAVVLTYDASGMISSCDSVVEL